MLPIGILSKTQVLLVAPLASHRSHWTTNEDFIVSKESVRTKWGGTTFRKSSIAPKVTEFCNSLGPLLDFLISASSG